MVKHRPLSYLGGAMQFLARFSPFRAIRDLRVFLSYRQPYELGFLALAVVLTTAIIAGLLHDSHVERPYQRNIVYAESWPLDRSDAEIRAQQKIDAPIEAKRKAEQERILAERRAVFKRYDDKLNKWGL